MICLSGDLHHMSLNTGNQQHSNMTELQVARRYLDMLNAANVKVTYFISGKCFIEEWDEHLQYIADHPLVEVAGHNFSCFTPEWWHRISVCGSSFPRRSIFFLTSGKMFASFWKPAIQG